MNYINHPRYLGRTAILCTLVFGSGITPALSDNAAPVLDDADALSEIVVTAAKREESIYKVPISISALGSTELQERGAKTIDDLPALVPGLYVGRDSEQTVGEDITIRGVPSVAFYLDDTPLTATNLKLIDIDHIEVLRGPQGTLYGGGGEGGVIRYVSASPGFDSFSGFSRVELGTITGGDQSYEAQFGAGGPIVDQHLAYRASFFYRHDGGYIDLADEDTGAIAEHNINTANTYGGRLALGVKDLGPVEGTLSVMFQHEDDNGLPDYFTLRGYGNDAVPLPLFERVARVPSFRKDDTVLTNLTLKVDLGFAQLLSTSSYLDRSFNLQNDFSYAIENDFGLSGAAGRAFFLENIQSRSEQRLSQEFRLSSAPNTRYSWRVGAFYSNYPSSTTQQDVGNLAEVFPPAAGTALPGNVYYTSNITYGGSQKAVFGEATYNLTDALSLTAGARYSDLVNTVNNASNGFFNGGYTLVDTSAPQNGIVSPKYSVTYDFGPSMVYATASKGFGTPGANTYSVANADACQATLVQDGIVGGLSAIPKTFDADTIWNYEIGAKGTADDRRISYLASVYEIRWSGVQEQINVAGQCNFGWTYNGGTARVRGVDAQLSWRPIQPLQLSVNLGYTNARLTEDIISGFTNTGTPIVSAPSGTRQPFTPELTAAASIRYSFAERFQWRPFVRVDYQYIGTLNRDLGTPSDDPLVLRQNGYSITGVRLGGYAGAYEIGLFANNLFNAHPIIFFSYADFAPVPGAEQTTIQPRYVGVNVSRKF